MADIVRVPFAWADKRVLRLIRERCEEPASALGVYVALTVAASDAGQETFTTTHKWLASLSGFSTRTVQSRLEDLARLGAVQVSTPALKAPSTYTLRPFGNGCATFGSGCRTFGNGSPPTVADIRRKEETKKGRPLTTSERIGKEKHLERLRDQLKDMNNAGPLQRQRPGFNERLADLRNKIAGIEAELHQ